MKRLYTLLSAVLLSFASLQACQHTTATTELVGFVMDSTQALLPDVVVKLDGVKLTTSWDGRFVFKPSQWHKNAKMTLSGEGVITQKIALKDLDTSKPLVLVVQRKPMPESHYHGGRTVGLTMTRDAKYAKSEMATSAVEDGLYYAMGAPAGAPVYNNNVTAGKLTAGEVNDFARWNFWQHVLGETHKEYVGQWNIRAEERYTVQVINKNGYPLVNRPISLVDTKGNTVFQAVTDNTGKAELWNGLVGPAAQVNEPKWKTVVLEEDCSHTDDVDVMFVFDATGSMGDELRYLQEEMKDVIARATDATGGLHIRTGAVVYRDKGDEYVTRISRLTDELATTQAFIDKQEANGGGDYPEAIPEALMAALNSAGWDENARARIAFLILDAPCHQDSVTLALMQEQVLNAAALGVRVVPVVCSGLDKDGELLMRSIALATNGTSFFLTDDSGIGHPHLKPTTDSLKVEHLNDMLVRTIVEFSYVPDCAGKWHEEEIENVEEVFVPNPFDEKDLEKDETIPHGPTTIYLLDVSGKLIAILQGDLNTFSDSSLRIQLSTGIYFLKAFYDGEWHTRKILVH